MDDIHICGRSDTGAITGWHPLDGRAREDIATYRGRADERANRAAEINGRVADYQRLIGQAEREIARLRAVPGPSRADLAAAVAATDHDLVGMGRVPTSVAAGDRRRERIAELERMLGGDERWDAVEGDFGGDPGYRGHLADAEAARRRILETPIPGHALRRWAGRLPAGDAAPGYYLEDGRRFGGAAGAEAADRANSPDSEQQAANRRREAERLASDEAARSHPLAAIFVSGLAGRGPARPGVRLVSSLGGPAECETTGRVSDGLVEVRFASGWRVGTAQERCYLGLPWLSLPEEAARADA